MDPLVQQTLETQYGFQFVRRIGRGGFAEVWQAKTAEGVPCALKVSLDPLDLDNPGIRYELENLQFVKNLAGHPHVVCLQDVWQIAGYLVTRWELAEASLEQILQQYAQQGQQGIPLQQLLQYMADAAQGIDFLNGQGIVHRDIKPANLLVFFGRVKVGDLGLAKFIGASTASHSGAGTVGYLPPEAYELQSDQKGRLTPTVDLYGLAASYLKLRTGQEPFGTNLAEIIERQKQGKPFLDPLNQAERVVVLRALAPRPEDRPQEGASAWVKLLSQAALHNRVPAAWAPGRAGQQKPPPAPPPPSPTTTPPERKLLPEIFVDPWGKGDVQSLEEAIQRVAPDGIVRLSEGTHYLKKPLHLAKPVRLIGQGKDRTEVVCDGPEYVLQYSGPGRFTAYGITFKHTGRAPAHVLEIAGGEILLESCRFSGGVLDSQTNQGGCGLLIRGDSKGYIKQCQALHNEANGIRVADQAQPPLEANTCQENEDSGIAYVGSASGLARNNTCSRNKKHGIAVGEQAQPTLEANTCQENEWSGIAYWGSASDLARNNTCSRNKQHGIYVTEQAQPTLEANTCQENEDSGIAYFDSASGLARKNICSGNKGYGIYKSMWWGGPKLKGNICQNNQADVKNLNSNPGCLVSGIMIPLLFGGGLLVVWSGLFGLLW